MKISKSLKGTAFALLTLTTSLITSSVQAADIETYCQGFGTTTIVTIEAVKLGNVELHHLSKIMYWNDGSKTSETGVARLVVYPHGQRRYHFEGLTVYVDEGHDVRCIAKRD